MTLVEDNLCLKGIVYKEIPVYCSVFVASSRGKVDHPFFRAPTDGLWCILLDGVEVGKQCAASTVGFTRQHPPLGRLS